MAEEAVLDVFGFEGFLEEGVVLEVDHPKGEVVAGGPELVGEAEFFIAERSAGDGGPGWSVGGEGVGGRHSLF